MKIQILFSLFLAIFCFSQNKKSKDILSDYSTSNAKINKSYKPITLNKRISTYPFNKATKVKIISYNLDFEGGMYVPPPPPPNKKLDSLELKEYYEKARKPIDLKKIVLHETDKGIAQSKILNLKEISELTDIIYNTCSKYYITNYEVSKCFFPRNAILIYDENEKIIEIIEVCFQCGGIKSSPGEIINFNNTCEFIYPELEKFFQSKGLQTQYTPKN